MEGRSSSCGYNYEDNRGNVNYNDVKVMEMMDNCDGKVMWRVNDDWRGGVRGKLGLN